MSFKISNQTIELQKISLAGMWMMMQQTVLAVATRLTDSAGRFHWEFQDHCCLGPGHLQLNETHKCNEGNRQSTRNNRIANKAKYFCST